VSDLSGDGPGGPMTIENATLFGKVHTRELVMASNVIFEARLGPADTWSAPVLSTKKQAGCVRFSYVPVGSQVPRRFRCQPDLGVSRAVEAALAANPGLSDTEKEALAASVTAGERARIVPAFTELVYGRAAYAQLGNACPVEIREGGDGEAEMGAFHDLQQPQRVTNLHIRLDEYLRIGLEAGVFFAS